jgi:hypothetical protein
MDRGSGQPEGARQVGKGHSAWDPAQGLTDFQCFVDRSKRAGSLVSRLDCFHYMEKRFTNLTLPLALFPVKALRA